MRPYLVGREPGDRLGRQRQRGFGGEFVAEIGEGNDGDRCDPLPFGVEEFRGRVVDQLRERSVVAGPDRMRPVVEHDLQFGPYPAVGVVGVHRVDGQ